MSLEWQSEPRTSQMRIFRQNVPIGKRKHLDDTVTTRRSAQELLARLPASAQERAFFTSDTGFRQAFPDGMFNCWACPDDARAKNLFDKINVGDLVLFVRNRSEDDRNKDDDMRYIGTISAKCPTEAHEASKLLWPGSAVTYPYIFFFRTELGLRRWEDYCDDFAFERVKDTFGYFRPIKEERILKKWGSPQVYLDFLRRECHFASPEPVAQREASDENTRWLQAVERMADTTRSVVANAKGQDVVRSMKHKELRFASGDEFKEFIGELIARNNGRCAISGLPLQVDDAHDDPELVCSLDRIDSNGHYEAGNLQVVCKFINRWKNDGEDGEFRRLIEIVRGAGGNRE